MKKTTFLAATCIALFSALPLTSSAIPAMPGVRTVTQADGTTLKVRLVGDEFCHFTTTEDDYPLTEVNGLYYYATAGEDGVLVSSGIRAVDADLRSNDAIDFLRAIDTDAERAKLATRGLAAREKVFGHSTVTDEPEFGPMRATGMGIIDGETMLFNKFPHHGEHTSVVVLVQYQDVKFQVENPQEFFERMTNEEGFNEYDFPGSMRDYFIASSNGVYKPSYDVMPVITLANDRAYYGTADKYGYEEHSSEMALEAVEQLYTNYGVDFSKYDTDGDGYIDNIVVIYAGEGEGTGGPKECVWQHMGKAGGEKLYNGVKANTYVCINEWYTAPGMNQPGGMGVFVHEFSHALGLPDEYAPDYNHYNTPGQWSVMDSGCHLNNTYNPCLHSAYQAYCLGWNDVEILSGNRELTLTPHGKVYAIETDKRTEFFMFEARYPEGWDAYLPIGGMIVWHIDYNSAIWKSNNPNTNQYHQRIDLVEADNKEGDNTRKNDAFPGRSNQYPEFTKDTKPALTTWNAYDLGMGIINIARASNGRDITCTVTDESGINAVDVDNTANGPVEYFDVQGRRVDDPQPGQLLIRRQGSEVTKIF
ncbi:MAG: M6 family metalloprotease domain-containing protein [Muribaculaceae bacterium]|nr:M6 family metalloprotease domain-containing protein [Muribaculaceae bacterium]